MRRADLFRRLLASNATDIYEKFVRGEYRPTDRHELPQAYTKTLLKDLQEEVIRIAHISDLHFGRHYDEKVTHLQNRLIELRPHFVLISGDVVDRPRASYLRQAKDFINWLVAQFQHVHVVPGNHDRHGEVSLDAWLDGLGLKRPVDCRIYELSHQRYLFFFLLNSTWARLEGAQQWIHDLVQVRGWIDDLQLAWLRNIYHQLQRDCATPYARGVKIAILHHHLLPIRHSEPYAEPFLNLGNAAEVLHLLNDMRIDLILHGHKHVPLIRVVESDQQDHSTIVAAAGSATVDTLTKSGQREETKPEVSRNASFYLITLKPESYMITQYNYANAIEKPQKFIPVRAPSYSRRTVLFTNFEVDLFWKIKFPSTDWEVSETLRVERLGGASEIHRYMFELQCTKEATWESLGAECSRSLNGQPVEKPQLEKEPEREETYSNIGEKLFGFHPVFKLRPPLARGLDRDELVFTYTWLEGFFEFRDLTLVDGIWYYNWFVNRFTFTLEFEGLNDISDFELFAMAEEQKTEKGRKRCTYTATKLPAATAINYKFIRS